MVDGGSRVGDVLRGRMRKAALQQRRRRTLIPSLDGRKEMPGLAVGGSGTHLAQAPTLRFNRRTTLELM